MLRIACRTSIYRCFSNQRLRTTSATVDTKCVDIPRPPSLPIFGTTFSLIAAGGGSRLHEYIDKRHARLGPIFCENMNGTDIVFTSDPEFMRTLFIKLEGKYPAHILPEAWVLYNKMYGMRRGLFFMEGEEWLQNRKILNRLILKEGSESWLEGPINGVTQELIKKWKSQSNKGILTPNLEREFYTFAINVIVSVLTGTSEATKSGQYDYLLKKFAKSVQDIFKTTTKIFVWPSIYAKFNLQAWRNFKDAVDTSLTLARKIVTEIVMLKDTYRHGLIKKLMDEGLSEEDIVRIVADFVIAAGDTTSYTLLWTLYLLSNNADAVADIRRRDCSKYLQCVMKESMRLYPVAPFLTRIMPKDCNLGPYIMKEGTPIVASIYTSGRSEANFSEARTFLPQRWERDEAHSTRLPLHTPSATLPFALGARSCVGKKIAQLQLIHVLKAVTDNFDLKLQNKQKVDAVMSQVLVPKDPIKIQFMSRHT